MYQLSDTTAVQSGWVGKGLPTVKDDAGKAFCQEGPDTWRVIHSDTKQATPSLTYTSGLDLFSESECACMCLSVTFQDTACGLLEIVSGWI